MKKISLIAAIVLCFVFSASAQLYVGGAVGFNAHSSKDGNGNKTGSTMAFGIMPEVGYYLTEKFDVGLDFGFGTMVTKNGNGDKISSANAWGIAPYARYSVFKIRGLEVIGKAALSFEGTTDKTFNPEDKTTTMNIGFNISPILAYNLTENWVLFTQLNCFALGFNSETEKANGTKTGSDFTFGFNANANNLLNTNDIQIGFIYKF